MRNYMFDRSPAMESGPAPVRAGIAMTQARRRRGILVAALLLTLIVALVAATLIFRYMEINLRQTQGGADHSDSDPSFGVRPGDVDAGGNREATTIPRSPAGVGALMSVTEERGRSLSGAEIYQKVLPSVVSVSAYNLSAGSSGSGVVLSDDGYIITNYHVIEGMQEAAVTLLTDGSMFRAKLVGYYADLDIAVLKIDARGLTPAQFGSSRLLETGETVYAIGNPMGYLYGTITDGVVSAVNRPVVIQGHSMNLIQTSAALNSGNSGGALVNASGQVVGITSAKIDPPSEVTTEGLGLAIPICDVRRCVNALLRTGEMENPMMGIMCRDWPDGDGVLVVEIIPGGPAEAGGLLQDDVILTAGGVPVSGLEALKDVIYDLGVGAEMPCTVLRGGEELELSFELYGE